MEAAGRFEHAVSAYQRALSEDPHDADILQALRRVSQKAALEHLERYRSLLAQKAFAQAYGQLQRGLRAAPGFAPLQEERRHWWQVLVIGRMALRFSTPQTELGHADSLRLLARINTPLSGRTLDAEIDLESGAFFIEDTLYRPTLWQLAAYTLQSLGAEATYQPGQRQAFTLREHERFVNFRTPRLAPGEALPQADWRRREEPVGPARARALGEMGSLAGGASEGLAAAVREYSLRFEAARIYVAGTPQRSFTPQLLQVHPAVRKLLVDFGAYQLHLPEGASRWRVHRLRAAKDQTHYRRFAANLALQHYFPPRGVVFRYVHGPAAASGRPGSPAAASGRPGSPAAATRGRIVAPGAKANTPAAGGSRSASSPGR